eukprot:COSAG04_NODE_4140_length_2274_cov_2.235862_2_plen_460_part_00
MYFEGRHLVTSPVRTPQRSSPARLRVLSVATSDGDTTAADDSGAAQELRAELRQFQQSFEPAGENASLATAAVETALGAADAYTDLDRWEPEPSKVEGAAVWRRPAPVLVPGATPPFRTSGVVKGVPPLVLAVTVCEKLSDIKRKEECRVLQQIDWATAIWYEREKIGPWPLALRESLFVVHWRAEEGGAAVRIVNTAVDLPSLPIGSNPVRAKAFVVHDMRAQGDDTVWSMHIEFNAGGQLPTKLVDKFLYSQCRHFEKTTRYFASEAGIARKEKWEEKLSLLATFEPSHPLYGSEGPEPDGPEPEPEEEEFVVVGKDKNWRQLDLGSGSRQESAEAGGGGEDGEEAEVFNRPSVEELHAEGEWLVDRRVSVDGLGPGTVVAFHKNRGWGASSHEIVFDADGARRTVKLARKTNTDPEKKAWKTSPKRRKGSNQKAAPPEPAAVRTPHLSDLSAPWTV